MRQVISKEDLKYNSIIGKWVVQIDKRNPDVDITNSKNPGFWLEKRIAYVGQIDILGKRFLKKEYDDSKEPLIILNGLYYCHGVYTLDGFVEWFNDCLPTYSMPGKGRFLRLLTAKEIEWLMDHFKELN